MHFIIVLTSLTTTHEAQSPIGGGSGLYAVRSVAWPTAPNGKARPSLCRPIYGRL